MIRRLLWIPVLTAVALLAQTTGGTGSGGAGGGTGGTGGTSGGTGGTGGGVGNTGGTYDRTSDTVTFTLTAGTVSRLTPDIVQIDGYGATGASGSPYLDSHGKVVAVLYGGEAESGGRIVYAVPAALIAELLQGL